MNDGNQERAMCETAKQPKYADLMQIHIQIMDIHQRICDLNSKLGVISRNDAPMPCPPMSSQETPKMPAPESLVSVLDQLPGMVAKKVTQINSLLNDLEENLT